MKQVTGLYKKYMDPFFTPKAAAVYMILFAAVIGVATFIENDFGTSAAQKTVFKTWWFELLLLLFSISIVANVFRFRMIQQRRWAVLIFHFAVLFIMLGAAITRYFGYEGMMHIREGAQSNQFLSSDMYLQFTYTKGEQVVYFDEPVLFASRGNNSWSQSFLVGNDLIEAEVQSFIPNPIQMLREDALGDPVVKVVMSGNEGREEYFITEGQSVILGDVRFNFSDQPVNGAFNLSYTGDSLQIWVNEPWTRMTMATQQLDTLYPGENPHPLVLRSLYSNGVSGMVFSDFKPAAMVEIISEAAKVKNESLLAVRLNIAVNGEKQEVYVAGKKGMQGSPKILDFQDAALSITYGAKTIRLPFAIKLYDFQMERYPGTNSAASYASEVQLIDARKALEKDFRIYMNNILNYGGYRFFQSSFDKDERGTYLSVNHDFWGTWVSYFGYFLFTLGLVWTFFQPRSRFNELARKLKHMQASRFASLLLILCCLTTVGQGQKVIDPAAGLPVMDETHARKFSELVVQDYRGRMKPMHTLTREVMRKLAKTESLYERSSDQLVLSMYADQATWITVPIVKLGKHSSIKEKIGISGEMASFRDFFDADGRYVLQEEVRRAYELQPIDRGTYEKELIKVDERVNIANMVFTGRFFKVIPVPDDPNNTWLATAPRGMEDMAIKNVGQVASRFFTTYQPALHDALHSGDFSQANLIIDELKIYQRENGGTVVPSETALKGEILLNNLRVFSRLSLAYTLLGLGFLSLLFISVFKTTSNLSRPFQWLYWILVAAFVFHTFGLGLRWYVSGRAPWSNGYESMIYIAWTAALAGILLTRRSPGGLAATSILSGTILLVAQLSYLDPEITPLVPVLRSYWLTIHVSLVAGSYGFLMLGAIIGLINLMMMMFLNASNRARIMSKVKELSFISEMTLIGGLVMLSVGTYLGGIWANESWGRYWGWDAKETWALVTILVYAFILHMRLIPGLKGFYKYNLATLFGWASVIMTYFGVNYYLSGLHSYAAGDPVPIPSWVYVAVALTTIIAIVAYVQDRRTNAFSKSPTRTVATFSTA